MQKGNTSCNLSYFNNGNHKKIENYIKKYNKTNMENKKKTKYIIIDGTLKLSASIV